MSLRPTWSPALAALALAVLGATALVSSATAQSTVPASPTASLRWRMIGPFRAGRTKSAVGVPSQPNVF